MELFNLSEKKPALDTTKLVINFTKDGFDINGMHISLPCDIKALEYLFGEAKKNKCNYWLPRHPEIYYFTWDDIGMYCHSFDGTKVFCLCVKTYHKENVFSYIPKGIFKGVFKIEGKDWLDVMKNSELHCFAEQGEGLPRDRSEFFGDYYVSCLYTIDDDFLYDGKVRGYEDLWCIEIKNYLHDGKINSYKDLEESKLKQLTEAL